MIPGELFKLSLDDSGQNHLVLGTDRFGILVGRAGKGFQISPQIPHFDYFVDQTFSGAVKGAGVVIIRLHHFVHLIDGGLEILAGLLADGGILLPAPQSARGGWLSLSSFSTHGRPSSVPLSFSSVGISDIDKTIRLMRQPPSVNPFFNSSANFGGR